MDLMREPNEIEITFDNRIFLFAFTLGVHMRSGPRAVDPVVLCRLSHPVYAQPAACVVTRAVRTIRVQEAMILLKKRCPARSGQLPAKRSFYWKGTSLRTSAPKRTATRQLLVSLSCWSASSLGPRTNEIIHGPVYIIWSKEAQKEIWVIKNIFYEYKRVLCILKNTCFRIDRIVLQLRSCESSALFWNGKGRVCICIIYDYSWLLH